jgi:hypothetical protein
MSEMIQQSDAHYRFPTKLYILRPLYKTQLFPYRFPDDDKDPQGASQKCTKHKYLVEYRRLDKHIAASTFGKHEECSIANQRFSASFQSV